MGHSAGSVEAKCVPVGLVEQNGIDWLRNEGVHGIFPQASPQKARAIVRALELDGIPFERRGIFFACTPGLEDPLPCARCPARPP